MINEIIGKFLRLEVKIPDRLKQYPKANHTEYILRERKNFVIGELIRMINDGDFNFRVSESGALAVGVVERHIAVLQKLDRCASSRYIGGKAYEYVLTIFVEGRGKEIFTIADFCDEACYDSLSYNLPVMDLYDVAVNGKKRTPKIAHLCGMQGYNPMTDFCPAC